MKKRIINIIIVMLLTASVSFGQIVLTTEDQGYNPRLQGGTEFGVMVPMQNINLDQYTENLVPLGEGWLLLAFLGGAWALRNKVRSSE